MKRANAGPSNVLTPEIPARFVARQRLAAQFERGAAGPLTLVAAGPGSGKTAALAHWALTRSEPIGWLSIDRGDNSPQRFWSLVGDALFAAGGIADARLLDALVHDPDRPSEFVEELLEALPGPATHVLVIDDAHLLTDPVLLSELDDTIRFGSQRLHLVISARSDPLLPLHRYRLAGAMREVRADALAMTRPETRSLLRAHGVTLRKRELDMLAERTEGWIAGLRLSAMTMAESRTPEAFVTKLTIDQGSIGEYLVEEVLQRQTEPVRRLLIETSFLDEVGGPLAAAITGLPDAPALLAELSRTNSFVIPVEQNPDRYRYHPLLAEILRYLLQREGAAHSRELRRRAAAWFDDEGDVIRAIRFAVEARDWPHAARVLARGGYAQGVIERREFPELMSPAVRELADAPVADEKDAAVAAVASAVVAQATGRVAHARAHVADARSAEHAGRDGDQVETTALLVEIAAAQLIGDSAALDVAAQALLDDARPHDPVSDLPGLRAAVLLARASGWLWSGASHAAVELALLDALGEAERTGAGAVELEILGMLQFSYADAGRLQHARDCELRVQSRLRRSAHLHRGPIHHLALGYAAHLRADFAAAARHLRRAEQFPRAQAEAPLRAAITLIGTWVAIGQGDLADAHQMLKRTLEPGAALPAMLANRRALTLADLETRFGRPNAALRLVREASLDPRDPAVAISLARALGALGDHAAADTALRPALLATEHAPPLPLVIHSLLMSAWIASLRHDEARACADILRATHLAPAGIVEPFHAMRDALRSVVARHPDIASAWPAAVEHQPASSPPSVRPLIATRLHEPLTDRETAVLRRLATTMTTGEIAEELCVSVNTVKTHIAAIYRKLPAAGRRDAVARARQIELL